MSKASVIIPTYDRANLLRRAIQSVLDQTYQDFELVVVDDACTDNTEEIVKRFNDHRVRYIHHAVNKGLSGARNTGIKNSNGEYITFLDDDDEWLPEYLAKVISCVEAKDTSIGLVYCSFYRIDPDTKQVLSIRKRQKKQRKKGGSIGFPSRWIVRREIFDKVGMFDEEMNVLEDVEMSFRVLKHYEAMYVSEPLVKLYSTECSLSSDIRSHRRDVEILLDKHSEIMNSEELADWYILLADSYFLERNLTKGRRTLTKAMRTNPFNLKIPLLFLASFLGCRLYFNLTRILNLNVAKVIRRINKFMKG